MPEQDWWRSYEDGQTAYRQGELTKAIQIFQVLLADDLHSDLKAAVLNDLGVAWHRKGDVERAVAIYEEALPLERTRGPSERMATLLLNLGGAYADLRRFKESTRAYEQGLVLLQELRAGEPLGRGIAWRNLGNSYLALGQESRAVWAFQKSIDLLEGIEDKREMGITLHRLGEAYLAKYKWPEALGAYRQAAAIWESLGKRSDLAATYLGRGQVYFDWEKYSEASSHFQNALDIYRQEADKKGEAQASANLGRVATAQKEWGRGEEYYHDAIRIWEDLKEPRGLAIALWGRATLLFEKGDKEGAIGDMEKAVTILQEIRAPELGRAEHYLQTLQKRSPGPLSKYL